MPALIVLKVFIISSIYLISLVNCFNLENRLPIVKYGEKDSYFGYSIASHIMVKDDDTLQKW